MGCGYYRPVQNLTSLFLVMTDIRNNDYLHNKDVNGDPSQKLEWVTPKITLMDAGVTRGKQFPTVNESDPMSVGHS